jgi:hypothetical protein
MSRMTALERADWFDSQMAAAASAADADDRLSAMLADPALSRWEQTEVAAELGQARGLAGSAALRRVFSAATTDLAAASRRRLDRLTAVTGVALPAGAGSG